MMEIEEDLVVGFDLHKTHMLNNINTTLTEFTTTTTTTTTSSSSSSSTIRLVHETTTAQDSSFENGEQLILSVQDSSFENGEPTNGDNDILIHHHIAHAGIMEIHQGTNGFPVDDQNGAADVADEQVHVTTNGTSFSKATDTDIGLKCVESLLDESSSQSVNGNLADITATELNKVDAILKSVAPEYDVEGVILNQDTHDLFCPNCNSCITKRVILRRRKRKIHEISTGEDIIISSHPAQIPTLDDQIIVEPTPDVQESAVGALTCFSCFRIFISAGKDFLFWKSESKLRIVDQQESSPDTPHLAQLPLSTEGAAATAADASKDEEIGKSFPMWILTCCEPYKRERETAQQGESDRLSLSYVKSDISTDKDTSSSHESKLLGTPDADTPVSSEIKLPGTDDADTSIQQKHDPATALPPIPNRDITPGDTLSLSGLNPTVTCDSEKSFSLWFLTCCQPEHKVEQNESSDKQTLVDAKSDIAPDGDKLLPSEPKVPGTPQADRPSPYAKSDINTDKDTLSSPESKLPGTSDAEPDEQNQQTMHMRGQQIRSNLKVIPPDVTEAVPEVKVQLVVTPGEPPKPNLTENPHYTPHISGAEQDLEAQADPLLPSPSDEHPSRGVSGLDVIKAIVYGGLLETIASLGIISSAAGGDATTLNIVALGLANVLGGLIVLFHNLGDLKNSRRHYEEQLGKTGHFVLHTTIAIMSYLVFGLMAPVVYGFSFRENDDKNMKLITLAAASLICIVLLSIGKAYAQRSSAKDYIKTILYYASIGVLVSGLGYVSGQLINDGLKKLGVFDSESPVNMSVLEAGAVKAALSSY